MEHVEEVLCHLARTFGINRGEIAHFGPRGIVTLVTTLTTNFTWPWTVRLKLREHAAVQAGPGPGARWGLGSVARFGHLVDLR